MTNEDSNIEVTFILEKNNNQWWRSCGLNLSLPWRRLEHGIEKGWGRGGGNGRAKKDGPGEDKDVCSNLSPAARLNKKTTIYTTSSCV